jgi:hypothetical protein
MKAPLALLVLFLAAISDLASAQPAPTKAQEAALAALGARCSPDIECHFDWKRIKGGWSSIVWFCYKQSDGKCAWRVGGNGHAFVEVMDDGAVRVRNGA